MTGRNFIVQTSIFFTILISIIVMFSTAYAAEYEYILLRTKKGGDDIVRILKVIAIQARINLLVDKSVTGKIYAEFKNVYYKDAIKNIADQKNLYIIEKGNIIIISAHKEEPDKFSDESSSMITNNIDSELNALSKPDFDFINICPSGEDIRLVLKTIAVNAGKEIFYDDSTRGKITFNFKNTNFESTIRAIAAVNGLNVKKENDKYYVGEDKNISKNIDPGLFSTEYPGLGKNMFVPQPDSNQKLNPSTPPMPFKTTITVGGGHRNTALVSLNPICMIVSDDDNPAVIGVIKVLEIKENGAKIVDYHSGKERMLLMKR